VTTLPVCSMGDSRPSRLEVTVRWRGRHVKQFTDALVADMMKATRQQMEPEYIANGRAERMPDGGLKFFFTVSEAGRR
jgi:hypothetical protein